MPNSAQFFGGGGGSEPFQIGSSMTEITGAPSGWLIDPAVNTAGIKNVLIWVAQREGVSDAQLYLTQTATPTDLTEVIGPPETTTEGGGISILQIDLVPAGWGIWHKIEFGGGLSRSIARFEVM